ncbi:MAG: DGQHR domain-containing protein [Planctomycetaceae bacterium]|nr:DGQHR domain-containing protein [Planctomycetaceae bacterium]
MNSDELQLSVLRVRQPIGDFFITSIPAKQLVKISYSDVRRLVSEQRDVEQYLGIQRPVSPKRINDIRKYIQGSDATFPTAIIVAVDEKCASLVEQNSGVGLLTLKPYQAEEDSDEEDIPWAKIAKVLDGQHRIAAFMDENDSFNYSFEKGEFDLNLSIFIGADISEQANIFATVNLAQTKVNKSLVYDLTELAKTRSPQKTCHNVAVMLDGEPSSPLYQRIKRLGIATPGRGKEPLTQAGFVESLLRFISADPVTDRNNLLDEKKLSKATVEELKKQPFRNLFIEEKDLDIAEILYNYFTAVKEKWPKSWHDLETSGNLLPKSNAFKALMKYLKDDVYCKIVKDDFGEIPSVKEFSKHFDNVPLKDSDFTTKNFVPGSGGQSTFLKILRREIELEDIIESE